MANCPNPKCLEEFTPGPEQKFCIKCKTPLAQPRVTAAPVQSAIVAPAGEPVATAVEPPRAEPSQAFVGTTDAPPVGSSSGKTNVIGEDNTVGTGPGKTNVVGEENVVAGRDVNQYYAVQVEYCVAGDEKIEVGESTYRCPVGRHSPVCELHYDTALRMCSACKQDLLLNCPVCSSQHMPDEMFTCPQCDLVVGLDHKDSSRNWCTDCVAGYARLVEAIDGTKEVAISATGKVVTRTDVYLDGSGTFRTKEGDTGISRIKDTTWYARPRQWYEVRQPLLRREKQAMAQFYPGLSLEKAPDGDLIWQGTVTTWIKNSYEIMLRYPHRFPYAPPRAFVMNPKIQASRHIYPDAHLCLFHKDDKAWKPETTAATVVTWVSLWLHCYEVWQDTGKWPRPEADDMVITPEY